MKFIIFLAAIFALFASAYSSPTANLTGSTIAGSAHNATHNATATSTFALRRRQSTVANPFVLPIPSGRSVALSGGTNAEFIQRVTVSNQDGNQLVVFQGTGEASTLFTLDVNGNPTTNQCFTLPQQIGGKSLSLSFTFSESGVAGPYVPAVLKPPRGMTTVSLESEDSTDNDNNDTEFTVSFQTGSMPGC